jgi:hypothetical protein
MPTTLPPCGLYRTSRPIGPVPAGRLVYFHNHGEPGPGVYLPERWEHNRARFSSAGHTLPEPHGSAADGLVPLAPEGLYRVTEPFPCCEKRCRTFAADLLVQLGYDGEGHAILFEPGWSEAGLALPSTGSRVDAEAVARLSRLAVAEGPKSPPAPGRGAETLH